MFKYLLIITAFLIAAGAAYFSIYGLVQIYTGALLPIILMGSALEIGKLIGASFLYRYWSKINLLLKSYLIISVFSLMLITSIGIFGYLTASYQKDSLPIKELNITIERDSKELDRLMLRKSEIDKQITELPKNYVNGRVKLLATFSQETKELNKQIKILQDKVSELQNKQITTEAHVGPIMFVAKVLNQDPDDSIFYFTLLIMLVFDPLAVALTLAANICFKEDNANENSNVIIQAIQPEISIPSQVNTVDNTQYDNMLNVIKTKQELTNKTRL